MHELTMKYLAKQAQEVLTESPRVSESVRGGGGGGGDEMLPFQEEGKPTPIHTAAVCHRCSEFASLQEEMI